MIKTYKRYKFVVKFSVSHYETKHHVTEEHRQAGKKSSGGAGRVMRRS